MKKSRFSEEQITQILAESRAGVPTVEICRKYGVSPKTFYGWRQRYGGMVGSEVRRVKELESTIYKLERIVARQAVELEAAKFVIRGKW
jgi:putative transposase